MITEHFEFLVEEPSMEAFLEELLPPLLADRATFKVHAHQGKPDLMRKLMARLRGYSKWLPINYRIVIIVDRDGDECAALKQQMENCSVAAGLRTRSRVGATAWQAVNRIAIEELEAWFFGDWHAVREAYSNVAANIPTKAQYRNSDAIAGGTWEALERILRRGGYFVGGYRKVEAAKEIGRHFAPTRCSSASFRALHNALNEALACEAIDRVA
jgi:Domain of unknown function (DUF4276)